MQLTKGSELNEKLNCSKFENNMKTKKEKKTEEEKKKSVDQKKINFKPVGTKNIKSLRPFKIPFLKQNPLQFQKWLM